MKKSNNSNNNNNNNNTVLIVQIDMNFKFCAFSMHKSTVFKEVSNWKGMRENVPNCIISKFFGRF